jgi:hypothetical protein
MTFLSNILWVRGERVCRRNTHVYAFHAAVTRVTKRAFIYKVSFRYLLLNTLRKGGSGYLDKNNGESCADIQAARESGGVKRRGRVRRVLAVGTSIAPSPVMHMTGTF